MEGNTLRSTVVLDVCAAHGAKAGMQFYFHNSLRVYPPAAITVVNKFQFQQLLPRRVNSGLTPLPVKAGPGSNPSDGVGRLGLGAFDLGFRLSS